MAQQEQLFYSDIYEATGDVIRALGGMKRVGQVFWPEKSAEAAGEQLRAAINPARKERLNPEQMLYLKREARKIGCHILIAFENQECGYAPPQPREPEDEKAELKRQTIAAAQVLRSVAERLEKLEASSVKK